MFSANRLRLARQRRRLTGKALAELVGVSPVTISRLESASNEPEPSTVAAIAKALSFPESFFLGDDIEELPGDAASFRSLTAMSARERDAALAAGALAYLVLDWVAERFNLPAPDLEDLSHERNPENAAIALRQSWALGEQPIVHMVKLLESKGVRVLSLCENTKNVDAFSCWRDGIPHIFLNTFKSAEHTRFDAAHELGHLTLHKHGGPRQGRDAEVEANAFASSFLMPSADILGRIRFVTGLNELISAKRRWGVSVAALTYRLHRLGVVSDWQNRMLCIQLSKAGYRSKEPSPMVREESVVWKQVFSDLWDQRVTREHIAQELNLPPDEIENLVFGLVSAPERPPELDRGERPKFRLV
jgi:Zn-dependent peptidase ImmA (M78 family)/DNA-binding XRE family transcriptional regulator